jgi:hypothetical protein
MLPTLVTTRLFALAALLATELRAQSILLELRPRTGDTLRMQLDQVTEMSGTRRGLPSMQVVTTVRMYSRAIVESRTAAATLILAITDSVDVSTSDQHARALASQTEAQLAGRQMRLRLLPNGTVTLADESGNVPKEVADLISVMPASFPKEPVAVGDTWSREMPIPAGTRMGVPVGGVVRSSFRFDSLSRGGDFAYVGMRGKLQPASTAAAETIHGSVDGTLVIDRRRGWLSETRFLIQMRTTIASSPQAGARLDPMTFRMKITQHMRVSDRKRER